MQIIYMWRDEESLSLQCVARLPVDRNSLRITGVGYQPDHLW
jgi:hypothetical protein